MQRHIETEREYLVALARVYDLMQLTILKNSAEEKELIEFSTLIQEYELKWYPIFKH